MPNNIQTERVTIPIDGKPSMGAYQARPSTPGKYPAVIVGMALFGVTQHIREMVDHIAQAGYLAIAPDFYHRIESGVELADDDPGIAKGF